MNFEDLLKLRLDAPVRKKGSNEVLLNERGEQMLPMEAMVMSVVNNAMKGDIASIQFIRRISSAEKKESIDGSVLEAARLQAEDDIREMLKMEGLQVEDMPPLDIERLSHDLLTLRRLEGVMESSDHRDLETEFRKDGSEFLSLSPVNRLHGELAKKFKEDLQNLRNTAQRIKLFRKRGG